MPCMKQLENNKLYDQAIAFIMTVFEDIIQANIYTPALTFQFGTQDSCEKLVKHVKDLAKKATMSRSGFL